VSGRAAAAAGGRQGERAQDEDGAHGSG
jgi:hypothetical protein